MDVLVEVLADLAAESSHVDALVAERPAADWGRPTPAPGWTVAHQIGHLAWTDDAALLAVRAPDEFAARLAGATPDLVDAGAAEYLDEPPRLLERWRAGRRDLHAALAAMPSGSRVPWYGTSMTAPSMATARLMETWAHGLDVADGLGVARPAPTARLRHIAYLGYRALPYAYLVNGRPVPEAPIQVRLTAPDGSQWTFGPEDADNVVTGSALDFCLRVTQRGHRADLDLRATGPVADEWLDIAQAFAGQPGAGRPPAAVAG